MSASIKDQVPASQKRAQTYNVIKAPRRHVRRLTCQENKNTQQLPIEKTNREAKNNYLGIKDSLLEDSYKHRDIKLKEDIGIQKETTKLSLVSSKSVKHLVSLSKRQEKNEAGDLPVNNWQDCRPNRMASNDAAWLSGSSESSNPYRKEDTFIVTSRRGTSSQMTSAEDLRRRKAMVLAKANARHAIRTVHNHSPLYSDGLHRNFHLRYNVRSKKLQKRAYVENTGSEVTNDHGEKIYFQWKERENSETRFSRVPEGVRKLYVLKKNRKRNSQVGDGNSKSAPNNKTQNGMFVSQKSGNLKRSRTPNRVVHDKKLRNNGLHFRKRLPSSSNIRQKHSIWFADKEKDRNYDNENTFANKDKISTLTTTRNNLVSNLEVEPENNGEVMFSNTGVLNKSDHKRYEDIQNAKDVTRLRESPSLFTRPLPTDENLPVSRTSVSRKLLSQNGERSSNSEQIRDILQVPYAINSKIIHKTRYKSSNLVEKRQKNVETNDTKQRNIVYNSVIADRNVDNAAKQTLIKSETKESESQGLQKSETTKHKVVKSSRHQLKDNIQRDTDLSSNHWTRLAVNRKVSFTIIDSVTGNEKGMDNMSCYAGNSKTEQTNGLRSLKDIIPFNSSTTGNTPTEEMNIELRKKYTFFYNDRKSVNNNPTENKGIILNEQTNGTVYPSKDIQAVKMESNSSVRDTQNSINSFDTKKSKYESVFDNETISHKNSKEKENEMYSKYKTKLPEDEEEPSYGFNKSVISRGYSGENLAGHNVVENISGNCTEWNGQSALMEEMEREHDENFTNSLSKNSKEALCSSSISDYQKFGQRSNHSTNISPTVPNENNNRSFNKSDTCADISSSKIIAYKKFVNKSKEKKEIARTRNTEYNSEQTTFKQEVHSRMTTQEDSFVASHASRTSQQDVNVSMTTSQVNRNITLTSDKTKQIIGMNSPLSYTTVSENNKINKENKSCNNETIHSNLFLSKTVAENRDLIFDKETSLQKVKQTNKDISVTKNARDHKLLDKQVYIKGHDYQSQKMDVSKETLKLEMTQLKSDDETIPSILTNRYSKETILPHLNLSIDQILKRNMDTHNMSSRNSKSHQSFSQKKVNQNELNLCQKTKENVLIRNSIDGNRLELNLAFSANRLSKMQEGRVNSSSKMQKKSANSVSKIQEKRVNSDDCEDTLVANGGSINSEQIIYDRICPDAISNGDCGKSCTLGNREVFATKNSVSGKIAAKCERRLDRKLSCDTIVVRNSKKSVLCENNTCSNSSCINASFIKSGCEIIDRCSRDKQIEGNISLTGEQKKELVKHLQYDKSENRKDNIFQNTQGRAKEHDKRQTLNLHTQTMEFRDSPVKGGINNPLGFKQHTHLHANNKQEVKGNKNENSLPKENEIYKKQTNGDAKDFDSSKEYDTQTSTRPKTAGLSAYSKHQSEDLWSINTGDGGDNDEDDQIQFIDGEQDFFKVFGYDDETAAILIATKVYPVSGSADASVNIQKPVQNSSVMTGYANYGDLSEGTFQNPFVANAAGPNGYNALSVTSSKVIKSSDITKSDEKSKTGDQKKQTKVNNNAGKGLKAVNIEINDFSNDAYKGDYHHKIDSSINKYNHIETGVQIIGKYSPRGKQAATDDRLVTTGVITGVIGSKHEEHVPQPEWNGSTSITVHNRRHKGLTYKAYPNDHTFQKSSDIFKASLNHVSGNYSGDLDSQPANETLKLLGNPQEGGELKTRRRIYSENDVLSSNIETPRPLPASDYLSDGNLSSQAGNLPSRENALTKDLKSHVALRNQLATEKHISQTRNHRYINNNFPNYQKNVLQISPIAEPRNPVHKDKAETKHAKVNEMTRPVQVKNLESTVLQETDAVNPYQHAADRIMSRFADTENMINNRKNNGITPHAKFQEPSNFKDPISSPIRRMSHPVDRRDKNPKHTGSYFVSRPRKLEPIFQHSELQPSQR